MHLLFQAENSGKHNLLYLTNPQWDIESTRKHDEDAWIIPGHSVFNAGTSVLMAQK